jgi:outer membrane protein assembly factor BamB
MRRRGLVVLIAVLSVAAVIAGRTWKQYAVWEIRPRLPRFERPQPISDTHAAAWPGWRGPLGNGCVPQLATNHHAPSERTALRLTAAWKTAVPGLGHSSPVVGDGRVIITLAEESPPRQMLGCYSLTDGNMLWTTELAQTALPPMHAANSAASSTPCCDGEFIYAVAVVNDNLELAKVALADGGIRRRTTLGPFVTTQGYGASPMIAGNLVIVACESRGGRGWRYVPTSYLVAVDRQTGQIVWRKRRPVHDGYASPVALLEEEPPVVLQAGAEALTAYRLADGEVEWAAALPFTTIVGTPVVADGSVFVSSTQPERLTVAVALPSAATETPPSAGASWQTAQYASYVPSITVVAGNGVMVDDKGVGTIFASSDGRLIHKQRVADDGVFASPIALGPTVITIAVDGTVWSWRPDAEADESKPQQLFSCEEPCYASPAVAGAWMIVRSTATLWGLRIEAGLYSAKSLPPVPQSAP